MTKKWCPDKNRGVFYKDIDEDGNLIVENKPSNVKKKSPIIDVYAKTTEKVLQHKLKCGLQSKDRYAYWTCKGQFSEVADIVCPRKSKNYVRTGQGHSIYEIVGYPECWIWELNCLNSKEDNRYDEDTPEVRLHMIISGTNRGYFKTFGANKDFTELWFHSEDWYDK